MIIMGKKWSETINASQNELIDTHYIHRVADYHRQKFDDCDRSDEDGIIPIESIVSDIGKDISNQISGYDFPVLFEPEGKCDQYVALFFQDPLRNSNAPQCMTIGSPFGITYRSMREQRRYRFLWTITKSIINSGTGVWISDVNKFWVKGKDGLSKNKAFASLSKRIVAKEIEALGNVTVCGFGGKACTLLEASVSSKIKKHFHPSARTAHLENRYGNGVTTRDKFADAFLAELSIGR